LQDLDSQISEAQAPIDQLEEQHQQQQSELNAKITQAQHSFQELSMNVDKLDSTNKVIER
jgi:DNA repair protein RAD50